jgi:peptide alpha-N-acetyltransferase
MIIREAKMEDWKEVKRLRGLLVQYEKEKLGNELLDINWIDSKEIEESTKNYIKEQYCFVAVEDERIVGIITGKISPERSWIIEKTGILNNLYVEEKYRGKGIATKLYERFCVEIKKEGIAKIELHTMTNNKNAIKFYERLGFKSYNLQMLNKQI